MKATSSRYSCQAKRSQKKMIVFLGLFFLLLFMLFQGVNPQPVLAATILYVDVDATGANDGTSWANAYIYLQDALDQANANGTTSYEIWVAEGVYYPDEDSDGGHTDNNRNEFFRLNYDNVQLYGGFAGSETQRSQRDWAANFTVLSGDIDKNDTNTDGNNIAESYTHIQSANAYHVLYLDGATNEAITSATVLDGFSITAGRANIGWNSPHRSGGGLYCAGGNSGACNPHVTNVVFIGNLATYYGGAMFNSGGGGDSSPTLFNVAFVNNSSGYGALCNWGKFGNSTPSLVNITFANNTGAAIFSESYAGNVHVNITNTIMWGNDAQITGYRTSQHTVKNSIVQDSGGSSNWSAGDITTDAGGNLDADPLFTDAANGDATLQSGSPAINTGSNTDLPADSADLDGDNDTTEAVPFDLAHTERIYDGTVDMGAYEKEPNNPPQIIDDTWQTVGSPGFSAGWVDYTSLALDGSGNLVVAFQDGGNGSRATVMRWGGSSWQAVGSPGFSAGWVDYTSLALDGSGNPVVAFQDGGNGSRATVMRWDGSSWQAVGSPGFSAGEAYYTSLALDSSGNPVVAFRDGGNGNRATAMRWDGSNWQTVGSPGFSADGADYTSLALDSSGNPVVAFMDIANGYRATVMRSGSSPTSVDITMSEDGSPTSFDLTLDATDPDNDTLTWSIETQAGNGTASASGTGSEKAINYTPDANYNGSDSFVVQVSDGALTDTITVNVTVEPQNDDPTANDDTFNVLEDSTGNTLTVLSNDDIAPDTGETLAITAVGATDNGGSVSNNGSDLTYSPAANFSGTETFTYTVSDGNGGEATATVTVTVTAETDAPLITEGDSINVTMDEDGAPTPFALTLHASDADGDTLTWSIDTQAGNGTASASGIGSEKAINYTPDANFNGSDSFVVQVFDGLLTDTITVNVTINPQNDAPVAQNDSAAATDADPVTISVLDNDDDGDGDSLTITDVSMPGKGTAVINGSNIIYTPDEGFEGSDTFTYTISDSYGGSDTAQVTINGSISTYTLFLPVVANNFANAPDLVVADLSISGSTVEVTIENVGNAPVTEEFWVDLYINPDTPPTGVNEVWELLGDEGVAWGITSSALPLDPAESLTLTIGDAYYDPGRSNFSGAIPANSTVYAQVDSANVDTTYGGVLETHEMSGGPYNNITSATTTSGLTMTVTDNAVYAVTSGRQRLPNR